MAVSVCPYSPEICAAMQAPLPRGGASGGATGSALSAVASMNELGASGPLVYDITGLSAGTAYFVRVSAENSIGLGASTASIPAYAIPRAAPESPRNVVITTATTQSTPITHADISWAAPAVDNGAAISGYLVEWYALDQIKEVQTIETTNVASGSFSVAFKGKDIGSIASDITAASLRHSLMTSSESMLVTVTQISVASGIATATFTGSSNGLKLGDVVTLYSLSHANSWATSSWTVAGSEPTSTEFQFTTTASDGTYSPPSLSDWKAKVMVIGDITVSRRSKVNGYVWSITFQDQLRNNGDQPMLAVGTGTLSSGTLAVPQVQALQVVLGSKSGGGTSEIQTLTLSSAAEISGYFRVGFAASGFSSYVPWNATDQVLLEALENLETIRQCAITREGDASASSCNGACPYGHRWSITFSQHVGDQPKIVADKSKLAASGNAVLLVAMDGDNSIDSSNNGALLCDRCQIGETPSQYGQRLLSATTYSYRVTGLVSGTLYRARISARNAHGYSLFSQEVTVTPPKQLPSPPNSVSVSSHASLSTSLLVNIGAPASDGGDSVLKYKIEYDTSNTFATAGSLEVRCPNHPIRKVVNIQTTVSGGTGTISGGYFRLSLTKSGTTVNTGQIWFDTQPMASDENGAASLVYKAVAVSPPTNLGSMQSILQDLSNMVPVREQAIEAVHVTRTGPAADGGLLWKVTFLGDGDDFQLGVVENALVTGGDVANINISTTHTGHTYSNCVNAPIEIPGLTQGTPYFVRVFAYNSLGYGLSTQAAGSSKPMRVPQSPTAMSLSVVSGTSLRVVFNPPLDDGGDTITSYSVQWDTLSNFSSANTQSHSVLYLSGGAPFTYTIASLVMGQTYYVRVAASNSLGAGPWGTTTPASEHPRQVPSAPTGVILGVTSGSAITVSYAAPISNGGDAIVKYKVEWDRASSFSSLLAYPHRGEVEVFASQNLSYTITGLHQGQVYYVRVSAANSVGYGVVQTSSPSFASVYNQIPGKPMSVSAIAFNSTSIRMDWSAPFIPAHGIACSGGGSDYPNPNPCPEGMGHGTDADGGVAISKYVVEWDTIADFSSANSLPLKGSAEVNDMTSRPWTYYLTNLPCYNYYVRVYAYNTIGQSQACNRDGSLCNGNVLEVTTSQLGC